MIEAEGESAKRTCMALSTGHCTALAMPGPQVGQILPGMTSPVSLEEAGDRLKFTFMRLPPSQWGSARTTNAIERLHEEFKRRIKTQTVVPSADTAAMHYKTTRSAD